MRDREQHQREEEPRPKAMCDAPANICGWPSARQHMQWLIDHHRERAAQYESLLKMIPEGISGDAEMALFRLIHKATQF